MKNFFRITAILIVFLFSACDLYPDWKDYVEYSDTYPLSGEYYVRDYDFNVDTAITDNYYSLYIYNKAYNPTGDSVWIDNYSGHPTGGITDYAYKFKIKTKADLKNLTFNCTKAGNVTGSNVNPLDSAISVTISNSKVFDMSQDITDATPDSIYFEFTYYDKYGNEVAKFKTYGHRKTGWEEPNEDDDM